MTATTQCLSATPGGLLRCSSAAARRSADSYPRPHPKINCGSCRLLVFPCSEGVPPARLVQHLQQAARVMSCGFPRRSGSLGGAAVRAVTPDELRGDHQGLDRYKRFGHSSRVGRWPARRCSPTNDTVPRASGRTRPWTGGWKAIADKHGGAPRRRGRRPRRMAAMRDHSVGGCAADASFRQAATSRCGSARMRPPR